jgi:hypothetical protein
MQRGRLWEGIVADTIKFEGGKADASVTISGTEWITAYGPPLYNRIQHRGLYIRQVEGAGSATFRWLRDEPTPGTTSPTSYSFASITR